MPLIESKSNSARQENIETEIHAGKPIKQAVAIGYSVQRHAADIEHDNRKSEREAHEKLKYGR